MFIVAEMNGRYVAAYPEGDIRIFANKELAKDFACALSKDNGGVFCALSLYDSIADSLTRARTTYSCGFLRFNY